MEMINSLLKEIAANNFSVGSWHWVNIVHIDNPHNFYIRPTSYSKYLPMLQAPRDHPDASEINIGDVFVYKSRVLKSKQRGKIVSCEKSGDYVTFKMFAMDFGCIEESIPLRSIWKLQNPVPIPSLATVCLLAGCAPVGDTWDVEATDAMKKFVENERTKMIIKNKINDKFVVELYNSCHDDIATLLAYSGCTTLGFVNTCANRYEYSQEVTKYYAQRQLQINDTLHVRLQYGILQEEFYVSTIEDYNSYLNDRNKYLLWAREQNDIVMEDLKINAPIGVYYDRNNKFERGVVKEILPKINGAKVQLVDWGNIVEVSVMKMKPMPDWYLRVPTRALWCTLHFSQVFSKSLGVNSHCGVEFKITIKGVGVEAIKCPNVVLILPLK